jgi:hypothetical protein
MRSHRTRRSALWTALLVLASGVSCLSPPERQTYQLHPGALTARDASVVLLGDARVARFDGLTARSGDWTEVSLAPGPHRIEWADHVPEESDPRADLAWLAGAYRFVAVLEPGHTYSLRASSDTRIVDETAARPAKTRPWEEP